MPTSLGVEVEASGVGLADHVRSRLDVGQEVLQHSLEMDDHLALSWHDMPGSTVHTVEFLFESWMKCVAGLPFLNVLQSEPRACSTL